VLTDLTKGATAWKCLAPARSATENHWIVCTGTTRHQSMPKAEGRGEGKEEGYGMWSRTKWAIVSRHTDANFFSCLWSKHCILGYAIRNVHCN